MFGEEAGDAPPTAAVPLQANGHGAAKHKKQRPQQQQPNGGAETAPAEPWAAAQAETTWSGLGLGAKLCEQLSSLQFERPTRVQRLSIPPMLAGRDVLVRAATGSGKTLSYLLPIIHDLAHQVRRAWDRVSVRAGEDAPMQAGQRALVRRLGTHPAPSVIHG